MVPVGAGTDGKAGSCWSMDHCWDKSMSSLHLGLLAFFLPHCTCIGIYWKRHVVPVWSVFKNLATTQVQEWWHPTPKLDCMIASNLGEYLYGEGVWQLLYYFAEETGDPLLECIGEILERYWRDIGMMMWHDVWVDLLEMDIVFVWLVCKWPTPQLRCHSGAAVFGIDSKAIGMGWHMAVGFSFGINMVYPWSNCWAWLFHGCFLQGICSILLEGKTCGNLGTEVSTLWLEAWVGQCFCGTRPFQQLFFGNCLVFYFCPTFFCINTVCIASSAMTEVQQCCWHPALDGIHEVFLEKELAAG